MHFRVRADIRRVMDAEICFRVRACIPQLLGSEISAAPEVTARGARAETDQQN